MKTKIIIGFSIFGILFASLIASEFPSLTEFQKLLDKLKSGNERYVSNKTKPQNFPKEREALTKSQSPYAIVLTCSDSRVPPEYIFDEELGKLFVIRTAGNCIDSAVIGSIEYAAEHLNAPLFVVMGHSSCGAVKATIEASEKGETPSPYINSIIRKVMPSVEIAKSKTKDASKRMDIAIEENVKKQIRNVIENSKIIRELVEERKLYAVGAVYSLSTGKVKFINANTEEKE